MSSSPYPSIFAHPPSAGAFRADENSEQRKVTTPQGKRSMTTSYPINRFPHTLSFLEKTLEKSFPSITFDCTEEWYNTDISNTLWCTHYFRRVTQQEALQSQKRYITQLYIIRGHYSLGGGFTFCVHRVVDKVTNNDKIWFTPLNTLGHYMHATRNVTLPYFFSERVIDVLYKNLSVQRPLQEVQECMRSLGDYFSDHSEQCVHCSEAAVKEKTFDVSTESSQYLAE